MQACWLAVLAVNGYGLYLAKSGTGYLTVFALAVTYLSIVAWPVLSSARRRIGLLWASAAVGLLLVSLGAVATLLGKQISTVLGPFAVLGRNLRVDHGPRARPWIGVGRGVGAPVGPHAAQPSRGRHLRARRPGPRTRSNFFVDVLPELGLLGVPSRC